MTQLAPARLPPTEPGYIGDLPAPGVDDAVGVEAHCQPVKTYPHPYGGSGAWRSGLQALAEYAAHGPGFMWTDGDAAPVAYQNQDAFDSIEGAAMLLRWHAVQVALGAGVPPRARSKGVAACIRLLAAMKHQKPSIAADCNAACDLALCKQLMIEHAFTVPEVEVALLAHPATIALPEKQRQGYAEGIVAAAAADADTRRCIARRERVHDDVEDCRREIGADWRLAWRRGVAYRVRSIQLASLCAHRARATLQDYVAAMVHCLLLGWQDWAGDLLQRSHARVAQGCATLDDNEAGIELRTPLFVLRLIDQWQSREGNAYPPEAYDEPVFEGLLAHWRQPDPAAIAPLLLAACERHSRQAAPTACPPGVDYHSYACDPYEILLVLHLRGQLGLASPLLDHPLMTTPLGVLPDAAPPFREALLDDAVARLRKEVANGPPFKLEQPMAV